MGGTVGAGGTATAGGVITVHTVTGAAMPASMRPRALGPTTRAFSGTPAFTGPFARYGSGLGAGEGAGLALVLVKANVRHRAPRNALL